MRMTRHDFRPALIWMFRCGGDRLDHGGILAIGLLLLAAGLYLTAVRPLEERYEALTTTPAQRPTTQGTPPEPTNATVSTRKSFLAFLPGETDREGLLLKVQRLGQAEHLNAGKIEYVSEPVAALPVTATLIRMEWNGSRESLLRFVQRLLAEVPSLSLRSLEFSDREEGSSPVLHLEAALYLKQEAVP